MHHVNIYSTISIRPTLRLKGFLGILIRLRGIKWEFGWIKHLVGVQIKSCESLRELEQVNMYLPSSMIKRIDKLNSFIDNNKVDLINPEIYRLSRQ